MTASTLTDRYIWAVQRSLPERQREDIDRELRATIADTIDGKIEAGATPADAERATITELGDPYRLAAGFADRPLHLIGPALFPDYIRLLKVLYAIVLPITMAGILLALLLGQPESVGEVIGPFCAALITVVIHFGFWPTLVFALIERSPDTKWSRWNIDSLPQLPVGNTIQFSDIFPGVTWMVIVLGGIAWGQFWPHFRDTDGAVIPFFDPSLWTFWLPFFIAVATAELVFRLALYRMRRWTWTLAVVNVVVGAALVLPFLWLLLTEQFVNMAFLDAIGNPDLPPLFAGDGVVTITLVVVLIATGLTDIVAGFVRASRGQRAPAA